MKEYIDKAVLLNMIDTDFDLGYGEILVDPCVFVELVENATAADVVERKRGEWIASGLFEDIAKCSVCGAKHFTMDCVSAYKLNFCPHCGADMRHKEVDRV